MSASYSDVLKCSQGQRGIDLQLDAEKETQLIAKPYPSFIPTIVYNKVMGNCSFFFWTNFQINISFISSIAIQPKQAMAIVARFQANCVRWTEFISNYVRWIIENMRQKVIRIAKCTVCLVPDAKCAQLYSNLHNILVSVFMLWI